MSARRVAGSAVAPSARAVAASCCHPPPTRLLPEPSEWSRSKPSVVRATRQPSPTAPSRMESRMRTSVKNTSVNDAPPLICRIGRISMPGRSIGTMNAVMPWCLGTRTSVRRSARPTRRTGARAPDLLPVDDPLVTVGDGPARRLARSEPAPGSENSWQHSSRAARDRGTRGPLVRGAPLPDGRGDQAGRDAVGLVARRSVEPALEAGEGRGVAAWVAEAAVLDWGDDGVVAALAFAWSTPWPVPAAPLVIGPRARGTRPR